jgi:hypothetical protein
MRLHGIPAQMNFVLGAPISMSRAMSGGPAGVRKFLSALREGFLNS